MVDINKNAVENNIDSQKTSKETGKTLEKGKQLLKTAAAAVVLSTGVQANDLLAQCDGIDRAGVIHEDKKNGKINGFPEKICVKKNKLADKKEALADKKEKFRKLVQILAMLSPKDLENEIIRMQNEIDNEDDQEKKERLKQRLELLKQELVKVKGNVA